METQWKVRNNVREYECWEPLQHGHSFHPIVGCCGHEYNLLAKLKSPCCSVPCSVLRDTVIRTVRVLACAELDICPRMSHHLWQSPCLVFGCDNADLQLWAQWEEILLCAVSTYSDIQQLPYIWACLLFSQLCATHLTWRDFCVYMYLYTTVTTLSCPSLGLRSTLLIESVFMGLPMWVFSTFHWGGDFHLNFPRSIQGSGGQHHLRLGFPGGFRLVWGCWILPGHCCPRGGTMGPCVPGLETGNSKGDVKKKCTFCRKPGRRQNLKFNPTFNFAWRKMLLSFLANTIMKLNKN